MKSFVCFYRYATLYSLVLIGLMLGATTVAQAQAKSGTTSTIVGDTLLVQCWPESVATKPRPVTHRRRPRVRKAVVAAPTAVPKVIPKVKAAPKKSVHRRPRATRKIRKVPAMQVTQVCREIPLPGPPKPRSTLVPAWAAALNPVGPPLPVGPEAGTGEAGGILPPIGLAGPVVGAGGIMQGGAVAAVPLIFLAFLHHHNDDDNSGMTPEPPVIPPVIPPESTVPEPSALVLVGTGLAGLGQVLRRRHRAR